MRQRQRHNVYYNGQTRVRVHLRALKYILITGYLPPDPRTLGTGRMAPLSTGGRRMVWVALLNLVYLVILLVIANLQSSSERSLVLQKSICSRMSASVTPQDTADNTTCNPSSVDKTRDLTSSLSSHIADKTQGSENVEEQVTSASVSSSGILLAVLSQITASSDRRKEDTSTRHRREVSMPSIDTSMPLTDTHTYHDIQPSKESTLLPLTFEPSSMHGNSPSSAHPTTSSPITSPPSTPSILPSSNTSQVIVPKTKTKTTEIRTPGRKVIELHHKTVSEAMEDHYDPLKSTHLEAATPALIGASMNPANERPSSTHLQLDITINATGVTLAVDGVQVRFNIMCNATDKDDELP